VGRYDVPSGVMCHGIWRRRVTRCIVPRDCDVTPCSVSHAVVYHVICRAALRLAMRHVMFCGRDVPSHAVSCNVVIHHVVRCVALRDTVSRVVIAMMYCDITLRPKPRVTFRPRVVIYRIAWHAT
jgi:hypothetical protein